jgi:hypothetical protein
VAQPIAFFAKAGAFSQKHRTLKDRHLKDCHPDRSFPARTGWEAQRRDLLFLLAYSNPNNSRGDTIVSDVGGVR